MVVFVLHLVLLFILLFSSIKQLFYFFVLRLYKTVLLRNVVY